MKKLKIAAVALAAASSIVAGPAAAGYFGVALNQNTVKDWDDVGPALDDGSFTSQSSDDKDNGFRVFAGFGDNENFNFEVGYSDFGEATFDAESDGCCFYPAGPVSVEAASTGLDFGLVGRAKISDTLGFLGRVGLLMWEADIDAMVGGSPGSGSEDGNDVFFGFGLELMASEGFSMRGEYTMYSLDDLDIDSLSISLVFRGGQ